MKKFKSTLAILLALIMVVSCGMAAFATDLEETDNNDSAATATDFDLTDTVKGRIEESSDVDYFTVDIEEAGIALITFKHEVVASSASYFDVQVLNADMNIETEFSSTGMNETTLSTKFGIEKGVHYIVVKAGQVTSPTLDYKFSLSIDTVARAEKESNDTPATATPMEYSIYQETEALRYIGNLSQNDVDYFVIDFKVSGYFRLYIYNSNGKAGEYKATVSKYIEGANGESTLANVGSVDILSSQEKSISQPIGVSAGKYYVRITGTVGGYETRALFYNSIGLYETEYNNNYQNANAISIGTEFVGSLFDASDVDCFKFTVTAANKKNKLTVTPDSAASVNSKWNVKVVKASGDIVTECEASVGARGEIDLNDFDNGVYYLVISASTSFHDANRYTINAEAYEKKSNPSFLEMLKSLDFSPLLDSFKGWFTKLDYVSIVTSIVASIKQIFSMINWDF